MSSEKADPQLSEISSKLDVLIRLNALNLVRGLKTQKEQIALLYDAEFQSAQIADIIGTTRNTVSVAISGIKKEREEKLKKETVKSKEKLEITQANTEANPPVLKTETTPSSTENTA